MKLLLDTHVLLWWLGEDPKLSRRHRQAIERAGSRREPLGVSGMSLWEIAKLAERGRLGRRVDVDELLADIEDSSQVLVLPMTAAVAVESTRLGARFHQDPADQIIVATGRCHGLTLLTVDERIISSGAIITA